MGDSSSNHKTDTCCEYQVSVTSEVVFFYCLCVRIDTISVEEYSNPKISYAVWVACL
jgi:hypothetical protein